jgi:hypothetical protein
MMYYGRAIYEQRKPDGLEVRDLRWARYRDGVCLFLNDGRLEPHIRVTR